MEPGVAASQVRTVIQNARDENPVRDEISTDVRELPLAPLPRAGFRLAKFILFIISGYIFFLIVLLIFTSFDATSNISSYIGKGPDSLLTHQMEVVKIMQEEKKSYRDYIMQISQMVLLNLLLPVLSAVLGYIFGSKEGSVRSGE